MSYNPFLVETGLGIPEANAYICLTYALNYHASRGNAFWATLGTSVQQQSIVRATEFVDQRYGPRFRGRRLTRLQGLEWPRANAFSNSRFLYADVDAVPRPLQKAIAELAIRAASLGNLAPDPPMLNNPQDMSQDPPTGGSTEAVSTGVVLRDLEKVGPIEQEEYYMNPTDWAKANVAAGKGLVSTTVADFWIPSYPMADLWMEQLIRNESRRLVRG